MRDSREIERKADVEPNRYADLIAWLNAEADRLDDHAAQDELDGEGLEVSSEGIELLHRRAELLSFAAEILWSGDCGDGAAAAAYDLDRLAAVDDANREMLRQAALAIQGLVDATPRANAEPANKADPDPKSLANLPDRWERESAGYDVDGNESDGRVRACAAQLRGALAVHERELTAERERRLLAELEVERLRAALGSARKDMVREVSELLRPDSSEAEHESANRLARGYERIDKAVLSAPPPSLAELLELVREIVQPREGTSFRRLMDLTADVLAAYPFLREGREG